MVKNNEIDRIKKKKLTNTITNLHLLIQVDCNQIRPVTHTINEFFFVVRYVSFFFLFYYFSINLILISDRENHNLCKLLKI